MTERLFSGFRRGSREGRSDGMDMKNCRRVCAHVHLDALEHNLFEIRRLISPETKIIAVIKADAYGHGAVACARLMETMDFVWGYGVATAVEAMELRRNSIQKPILVLGYTFPEQAEELAAGRIRPTIFSLESAQAVSEAAAKAGYPVPVHIKIDTGMSRIGYQVTEKAADEIALIAELPGIRIEGIFTHFSRADEKDKTFTRRQFESYQRMVGMLRDRGIEIPFHHVSNSAGILDFPEANLDAVRAGIILYGLWPSEEVRHTADLRPVLELKSHLAHVKMLEEGRLVSYGGTWRAEGERKIATVPVGYGDGYPRSLSNCGCVLLHGQRVPICGRVCMDQLMVDATGIPDVKTGDEVTLVGRDGNDCITVEELGELSGRFNYEFVCDLGKRIPRVYDYKGKPVEY